MLSSKNFNNVDEKCKPEWEAVVTETIAFPECNNQNFSLLFYDNKMVTNLFWNFYM